jgi:hypothetical protein
MQMVTSFATFQLTNTGENAFKVTICDLERPATLKSQFATSNGLCDVSRKVSYFLLGDSYGNASRVF